MADSKPEFDSRSDYFNELADRLLAACDSLDLKYGPEYAARVWRLGTRTIVRVVFRYYEQEYIRAAGLDGE